MCCCPNERSFLGLLRRRTASAVNVCVVCQIESAEASLGEISQEDVPPLAKVGLPHLVACLEIRGREFLIRLGVSNRNHIICANFRGDRNVAGEIEMDRQGNELVEWHEVVRSDEWNVEHQNESFLIRFVDVGSFHQEEV